MAKKVKKVARKKERYMCEVCGLLITVDGDCSCVGPCDIICCDVPMKSKK